MEKSAKPVKPKGKPRGGSRKGKPNVKPSKKYLIHSARSAIESIGKKADPFLHLSKVIAGGGEGADSAAKHMSQFIEPQLSRTELTGPDSSALTINMTFDKEPKK